MTSVRHIGKPARQVNISSNHMQQQHPRFQILVSSTLKQFESVFCYYRNIY